MTRTLVPLLAGLFCLCAGCSGGGGNGNTDFSDTAVITRATTASFSEDAKILAARVTEEPWISAKTANAIDRDLERIRAQFPRVKDIHPYPDFRTTALFVAVKRDAPWLARWESGTLATGEPTLDRLLSKYNVVDVASLPTIDVRPTIDTRLLTSNADREWFVLRFAQSLNIPRLVELFQSASAHIDKAEANGLVGDGNRITFEQAGDRKKYVFSEGWGDCPSGCISRHLWEFTIAPDGGITLSESGTPLSAGG